MPTPKPAEHDQQPVLIKLDFPESAGEKALRLVRRFVTSKYARPYFASKSWESVNLYRFLGVDWFRRRVAAPSQTQTASALAAQQPGGLLRRLNRFKLDPSLGNKVLLDNRSAEVLRAFEKTTRLNELGHVGFCLGAGLLSALAIAGQQLLPGLAVAEYAGYALAALNLPFILVQRLNRLRLAPAIKRLERRRQRPL